jgi:hypothetical protein
MKEIKGKRLIIKEIDRYMNYSDESRYSKQAHNEGKKNYGMRSDS